MSLQAELSYLQGHLATLELPHPPPQPPSSPQATIAPPVLSISDLPPAPAATATMPATYDLSSLFEPMAQTSWAMQHRPIDPRQILGSGTSTSSASGSGGGGDLQALARELLRRHGSAPAAPVPCSNAPPSQSHSK